jgi:hypothetical protein
MGGRAPARQVALLPPALDGLRQQFTALAKLREVLAIAVLAAPC